MVDSHDTLPHDAPAMSLFTLFLFLLFFRTFLLVNEHVTKERQRSAWKREEKGLLYFSFEEKECFESEDVAFFETSLWVSFYLFLVTGSSSPI